MVAALNVRPVRDADYPRWRPLWDGYNAFYGRAGSTALPEQTTLTTWKRFLDPQEPIFALVAEQDGRLVGLVHYLFHRSSTRIGHICYLEDLFTLPELRGKGIGRSLIEAVYERTRAAGLNRVYWQTHDDNETGKRLYEQVAKYDGFIVYETDV